MSGQETGTLTFLFTDIEGSTRRWEHQPEAMARAVARHDEIMRAAIAQHNGRVFKTIGDAFCAVFSDPEDAVEATVTAQKAIAAEDWGEVSPIRVRMGLHTGAAEARDNDYFGPTVNRVARIMSAGHGGQMLLSSATGEQVDDRLPSEVRVRDLGKHRLKDLARPERILQLIAAGLPSTFPRLKTVPSPMPGFIAAALAMLAPLIAFRVGNRASTEDVNASLFSPLSLYTGLKGLVIELSTLNEYMLLGVGLLFLLLAIGITVARWREVRREQRMHGDLDEGRFERWVVNQRTVAFLGALALLVLGAYAYQQYLWRVALPIPDNALGIAMTREASAATVKEQLADSLYNQGQAEQIVIRELPVVFDARDTERARELGKRINARAVIIYRTDEPVAGGERQYIAYVVFTNPSIGLTLAGAPDTTGGTQQPVAIKEGVPVPVLRTATLDELVNAAAGIISYDADDPRKAIEYLRLAVPADASAANTGIVNFYLGNAYALDNQMDKAADAYEASAAYYEKRVGDGEILGPQDELILAKTYLERGRAATYTNDWEEALTWYQKAAELRGDILARIDGLERPTDLHATYAMLYTLMADAYRYLDRPEDQRVWEKRAREEIDALVAMTSPGDTYALVQQSASYAFIGDCTQAQSALDQALQHDPTNTDALVNSGVIAMLQDRHDIAMSYFQRIIDANPNDTSARLLIANMLMIQGLTSTYSDPAYLVQAEEYYRQIIAVDPANIFAYQALASSASLRGSLLTLDATAQQTGDDLVASRSQQDWTIDPARREAAIQVYTTAIDVNRQIASELQPDSPAAAVTVAESYVARQSLVYNAMTYPMLMGQSNPDQADLGKQILADAQQIEEWTDRVLKDPNATRLDTLRAWAARLESRDRVWGWYAFAAGDDRKAAEAEQQLRDDVDTAVAYLEQEPKLTLDEISPARIIYSKAYFVTGIIDGDTAAGSTYTQKISEITAQEQQGRNQGITHYTTFCTETRDQTEGDRLLGQGDMPGAIEQYQAALKANPEHVPSLLGYGHALYLDGRIDDAIAQVTKATEAEPDLPAPWGTLAVYQLAAGDPDAARKALDQFLALAKERPSQERLSLLGDVIDNLSALAEGDPERVPDVLAMLDPIGTFLDDNPEGDMPSYQYPERYADLGRLALFADAPDAAEPFFRRALELDAHRPDIEADLVISLLVQDKDASAEIEQALADINDPYWANVLDYSDPATLRSLMQAQVKRYLKAFPDREAALAPLTGALSGNTTATPEPSSGVEGQVFTSAAHGYTLTWNDTWNVAQSSTDASSGYDSIQLTSDASVVQMTTAPAGTNPAGCLQQVVDVLQQNPAWATIEEARGRNGDAAATAGVDAAYATYTDTADAPTHSVYFIGCRTVPNASAFLVVFAIIPQATYEEQMGPVNELLAGVDTGGNDSATPVPTTAALALPALELDPGS